MRTDSPRQDALLDLADDLLALRGGQTSWNCERRDLVAVGLHQDRGREHRRAERAHADLIDTDHAQRALPPEATLGAEVRNQGHAAF